MHYTLDRLGPHGLPLIGRADWNDCLNLNCFSDTPGQSFQTTTNKDGKVAESVFIAGLFVLAAKEMAAIADQRGLHRRCAAVIVPAAAADGSDVCGSTVGMANGSCAHMTISATKSARSECAEGQIFIEPQGMCVMAGIGLEDGRAEQALACGARTPGDTARHRPAAARLYRIIICTWAKFPPIRPATRKTPVFSATPTPGS